MPKAITVRIGPQSPQIVAKATTPLPNRDDALDKAKRELAHLKHEVSRLQSKIRRLEEEIEWELKDWKAALDSGARQESYEGLKRRISRLNGALQFSGTIDYELTER